MSIAVFTFTQAYSVARANLDRASTAGFVGPIIAAYPELIHMHVLAAESYTPGAAEAPAPMEMETV